MAPPVAPMGWPRLRRPPSVLTGFLPVISVPPSQTKGPPSPGATKPSSSMVRISPGVKASWTWHTSTSAGVRPATSYTLRASTLVGPSASDDSPALYMGVPPAQAVRKTGLVVYWRAFFSEQSTTAEAPSLVGQDWE